MFLVAAALFIGGSILFVVFVQPRIDKNMERIRAEYRTGTGESYHPYGGQPVKKNDEPPEQPDPFEEYKTPSDREDNDQ